MKQLTELRSVIVATTVQKQQASTTATAASPAAMGTATARTLSPNDRPRLKVELQTFSGEEADWDEWHKVYSSQARIHGFAQELVAELEVTYSVPGYKESCTSTFTEESRSTGGFCPSISCIVPAPPADSREIGRIEAVDVTSG